MAPKKKALRLSSPPIAIGNCQVIVEAPNFTSESTANSLQISLSKTAKIKISMVEGMACRKIDSRNIDLRNYSEGYCYFSLVNPRDSDGKTKTFLKEVLNLYSRELPAMKYAADTGKESMFLERCISNGKYCTLILQCKVSEQEEEVVAAITYQIIPADTQFAEVPVAAVSSKYQKKGFGRLLYMELSKRLQGVGVRTIFCWGDKESEGFWLNQGFLVIGEVDLKGRARRLPIKAEIRKALCFPGGSTLLVSHLSHGPAHSAEKLKLSFPVNPQEQFISDIAFKQQPQYMLDRLEPSKASDHQFTNRNGSHDVNCTEPVNCACIAVDSRMLGSTDDNNEDMCSCAAQLSKKRVWEASYTSLKSKKIKGGHSTGCQGNCGDFDSGIDKGNKVLGRQDVLTNMSLDKKDEECRAVDEIQEHIGSQRVLSTVGFLRVLLMNIADVKKISSLTKIIEELGGSVTSDGTLCTHIVTGKARKTLNFCIGLCSGAWIVSSSWLKESYRKGRFVDEEPFILKDEEYESKYRTELKVAVLRGRENPRSLMKGHDLCVAAHVQPPVSTLTAIIQSAGGNVIKRLEQVRNPSKTIFIACEEDMEDALLAVKGGIQTFSTDWLMNCIMRQELDLDAPKFAESL